jgi:hypothetical protein
MSGPTALPFVSWLQTTAKIRSGLDSFVDATIGKPSRSLPLRGLNQSHRKRSGALCYLLTTNTGYYVKKDNVLDAIRIRDGIKVVLKRIPAMTDEIGIMLHLSSVRSTKLHSSYTRCRTHSIQWWRTCFPRHAISSWVWFTNIPLPATLCICTYFPVHYAPLPQSLYQISWSLLDPLGALLGYLFLLSGQLFAF